MDCRIRVCSERRKRSRGSPPHLGLILLIGVLALTVIGAGVVFSWILDAVGAGVTGDVIGDQRLSVPDTGLLAMRIGLEFGGTDAFVDSLVRAVIDGGVAGWRSDARGAARSGRPVDPYPAPRRPGVERGAAPPPASRGATH